MAVMVLFVLAAISPLLKSPEVRHVLSLKDTTVATQEIPSGYDNIVVVRAIDGDTLELANKEHVRLIGIDTPESRKNEKALKDSRRSGMDVNTIVGLGQKAKSFVQQLVGKKHVRLEFDVVQRDKYGRLLAYVYLLPDGDNETQEMFVNATIIQQGYASPMSIPPNVKFADDFKRLYQQA